MSPLNDIFRALQYRNYRLFFVGQSISLIGTWMQQIAMSWLVYRLTGSALLLGFVGFMGQLPALLLSPLAGAIADRYNRRQLLILTQTLAMVQALILALLVFTKTIAVWHLVVLSTLLGVINAFDIPIRQSFIVLMIEKREDLGNAIALNSSMFNVARLLGPSAAGVLIALFGEGLCFLLNAVSYLAVIASLYAMRFHAIAEIPEQKTSVLEDIHEGFRYVFNSAPIRAMLLLLSLGSVMGVPVVILMPVFAKDVFHGGAETLGFLMAMSGVGALSGAIYLAARKNVLGLGKIIAISAGILGLGICLFSLSRSLRLSMVLILFVGFGMMVQMAASNTVLQTIVEDDKRGRIMSFYTMAIMGMAPFGSLMAGFLANKIGAPDTLLFGGMCCVVSSLVFAAKLPALRRDIRPIYLAQGIITETSVGETTI